MNVGKNTTLRDRYLCICEIIILYISHILRNFMVIRGER